MQETQVRSLGGEDPLEKSMATHSSILAWRIRRTKEAGWTAVHGVAKSCTRLSVPSQHMTRGKEIFKISIKVPDHWELMKQRHELGWAWSNQVLPYEEGPDVA